MKYNTIIVEDEKHQQESMLKMIAEMPSVLRVGGIAENIVDAENLIKRVQPDLVFLDVMLPPNTSFQLLQKIGPVDFDIIFTTSFEEFAVKAFRLSAVDYLVKPLVKEEFLQAVTKFVERRADKTRQESLSVLLKNLQSPHHGQSKIALPTMSGYMFVSIEDIIRCQSDNTYTTFYLKDKRNIIVSKTLKECESLLTDFSFFRVHNSSLINLDYIVGYEKGEGGVVKMIDGSAVDVSRRRKEEFVRLFRKIGTEKSK